MEWYTLLSMILISLGALLFVGLPVAFSLALVSAIFTVLFWGGFSGLTVLASTCFSVTTSFVLLAIPLFLIMSEAILAAGVSQEAFQAIYRLSGKKVVSIGIASNIFCTMFGAVTGFAPATVVAIGNIAVPEMLRKGYPPSLALGLIGGGATLAILIPPSILMILYCEMAQVSVAKLFLGGIGPGLIASAIFSFYVLLRVKQLKGNAEKSDCLSEDPWYRFKYIWKVLPLFVLIFAVLGSIWMGLCTPTEAAGVGAAISLTMLFFYRGVNVSLLKHILLRSVAVSCMLYFVIIGATAFSQLLTYLGIVSSLAETVIKSGLPLWSILLGMHSVIFFLGMIVDAASVICISLPIFLPVLSAVSYDLLVFGIQAMINLAIGTLTPPVGLVLYVLKSIAPQGVDIPEIARGVIPFIIVLGAVLLLVCLYPEAGLFLVKLARL